MASNTEILPEGTDTIIAGSSVDELDEGSTPESDGPPPASGEEGKGAKLRAVIDEKTADIRGQATDKAREYALQGKTKAADTLDNVVKLVENAAGTVDEKVGSQYGDYARRAAESVAGFAATLRNKDVDELFQDARDAVRKSPAVAIGAAAAVGFLLARVVKSASTPSEAKGGSGAARKSGSGKDRPAA